ncbi:MAG TPA: hypothetical protein ENF55_02975 [Thermoprotei archaeon]|nr:hypothetical protein [Thermoprotei archaeon]
MLRKTGIKTNIPHLETSLGPWRKLFLYSKGEITKIAELNRDELPKIGLSPDYWPIIDAVRTWVEYNVPYPVVMVLWRLRTIQEENGGWRRTPMSTAVETGCVYRYIELAALAGETPSTDLAMRKAIYWLTKAILKNGGFPTSREAEELEEDEYFEEGSGEVGTTARVVRALSIIIDNDPEKAHKVVKNILSKSLKFIDKTARETCGKVCWPRFSEDPSCVTGATALATIAILELQETLERNNVNRESIYEDYNGLLEKARRAVFWLLCTQNSDGSWSEEPGKRGSVDVTYYVVRAIVDATKRRLVDEEKAKQALLKAFEWFTEFIKSKEFWRNFYDTAFALRLAVLFYSVKLVEKDRVKNLLEVVFARFMSMINETYKSSFDVYYSELAGIALMETVKALNIAVYRGGNPVLNKKTFSKLRKFSLLPPAFLSRRILGQTENPSELLYILSPKCLMKLTDFLVSADIVSSIIGTVIGVFFIIDVPPEFVKYIMYPNQVSASIFLWILSLLSLTLWLWMKLSTSRKLKSAVDCIFSFLITLWFFVHYYAIPLFSLKTLRVILFYTVLVDVVSWFADRTILSKMLRE